MTKASNAPAPAASLERFNSLIGKKLYAYAWQYDNDGRTRGTITGMEKANTYNDNVRVFLDTDPSDTMSSSKWEFDPWQMEKLLTEGAFTTKGWSSGAEASVRA